MDGLRDSMENMRLCNEKIQKGNMAIKDDANRISKLLDDMEHDRENIQKCAAEIENVIGKYEKEKQEAEETIYENNEANNRLKCDKIATGFAIFMVVAFTAIKNLSLCMPDEWTVKYDYCIYLADAFIIVANWEIILHTGYMSKLEKSSLYRVVTLIIEAFSIIYMLITRWYSPDCKEAGSNILSAFSLIYTFLCNYKEHK